MTDSRITKPKRSIAARITGILGKTALILLLFIILLFILVQLPPVQNFVRKKAQTWLQNKLHTNVQIGSLFIGIPRKIELGDVYIEDQKHDTLLAGGRLSVKLDMLKLLRSDISISEVRLDDIVAKVKRQLPDTAFNFQFILNAFRTTPKKPKSQADTSAIKMSLKSLVMNRTKLLYQDVVTGNDVEMHFSKFITNIDTLDITHERIGIPSINLKGLTARVHQTKPLAKPYAPTQTRVDSMQSSNFQFQLRNLNFQDIDLEYANDESGLYTHCTLGELLLLARGFDMTRRMISLAELQLNNTNIIIKTGSGSSSQKKASKTARDTTDTSPQGPGWRILASRIRLNNNAFSFDNKDAPRAPAGMDYQHLHLRNIALYVNNLLYSQDSIAGSVEKAVMKDSSGFELNTLQTDFLYASHQAWLRNLLLKTPGTELRRSAAISYESIEALKKDPGRLGLDIDIQNSRIQVKDILFFAPMLCKQPAFSNPNSTLYISGRIDGTMSRLRIATLRFRGLESTRLDIDGVVNGLPKAAATTVDLNIHELNTSYADLRRLLPAKAFPDSLTLPQRIALKGKLTGGMSDIAANINLDTDMGSLQAKGNLKNITDSLKAEYHMLVQTKNLNVGGILRKTDQLGSITASIRADGRGLTPRAANASFDGTIESAGLMQYTYTNLSLHGSIANQQLQAHAAVDDPNIRMQLDLTGHTTEKYPAIKLNTTIDTLNTFALHLTKDTVVYKGDIDADFPITDPDRLAGDLTAGGVLQINQQRPLQLDTIRLTAGAGGDSVRYLRFSSSIATLALEGRYRLTQVGDILQRSIRSYFNISPTPVTTAVARPASTHPARPPDPYNFTLTARIHNGPALKVLLPSLTQMEDITLDSRFTDSTRWQATLSAPIVEYGSWYLEKLQLKAGATEPALHVDLNTKLIKSGTSMAIYGTKLSGNISDNAIDYALSVEDDKAKTKYRLAGLVRRLQDAYLLALKPGKLLLNYANWNVPDSNSIRIGDKSLHITNFALEKSGQSLSVRSLSADNNAPIEVDFRNFRISTITGFVRTDSLLADGVLNGNAVLHDLFTQPVFTSDLTITNLSIKKDTVGDVVVKLNNKVQNTYAADVRITGRGNDIVLNGEYYALKDNTHFALLLDVRQLQLNTIQGATMGAITDASGSVNGKLDIKGTASAPVVNGDIGFNRTGFTLSMLNNHFAIDQQKINVNPHGIRFSDFTVTDSAGNYASIDGNAYTTNFRNYKFDINFYAEDFRLLNSTKHDNQLFYGQLYFNSDINLEGTEAQPVVDGNLVINEKTKLTIVLPQKEPGVVAREGVVEFITSNAVRADSLKQPYRVADTANVKGMDVSVNLSVNKKAELNLIIDEGNGDFLRLKGEANLNAAVDPSGRITLTGSYELYEGAYELSFNFLHRKFEIQKGSRIVWEGSPTSASVDITAIYIANTSALDLVENQLASGTSATTRNMFLQKLPFEVHLTMTGELLTPNIAFDVVLPTSKNYNMGRDLIEIIETRLTILRQETEELNKQVFALLLLNRFVGEDPFASSGPGLSAESVARQSASKILTDQLNRLAANLVQGVDINFDVLSTNDYSTGERSQRTDLNVGLSKRLLNDRLTVTVGSNFELEGARNSNQSANNIAGDVAVNYQLSKDGRYMLRAYRKNQYEGIIDGYVIETGVGFIITYDYDKLRELFQQRKEKRIKPGRKGMPSNK